MYSSEYFVRYKYLTMTSVRKNILVHGFRGGCRGKTSSYHGFKEGEQKWDEVEGEECGRRTGRKE